MGHHFQLIPENVPFEGLFTEVSLDAPEARHNSDFKTTNPVLKEVIETGDKFLKLYEDITLQALKNYELSNRAGSAQAMTADLAALYASVPVVIYITIRHQKQYQKAVSLLEKLSIITADHGWSTIDCALMKLYAQCLHETGNFKGHITILLKLLLHREALGPNEGAQFLDELERNLSQTDASIPPSSCF